MRKLHQPYRYITATDYDRLWGRWMLAPEVGADEAVAAVESRYHSLHVHLETSRRQLDTATIAGPPFTARELNTETSERRDDVDRLRRSASPFVMFLLTMVGGISLVTAPVILTHLTQSPLAEPVTKVFHYGGVAFLILAMISMLFALKKYMDYGPSETKENTGRASNTRLLTPERSRDELHQIIADYRCESALPKT